MLFLLSAYDRGILTALNKFAADGFTKEAISRTMKNRAASAAGQRLKAIQHYMDTTPARGLVIPGDVRRDLGAEAGRLANQQAVFSEGVTPRGLAMSRARKLYQETNPGIPLGQASGLRETAQMRQPVNLNVHGEGTKIVPPPKTGVPPGWATVSGVPAQEATRPSWRVSDVFTNTPYHGARSGTPATRGMPPATTAATSVGLRHPAVEQIFG